MNLDALISSFDSSNFVRYLSRCCSCEWSIRVECSPSPRGCEIFPPHADSTLLLRLTNHLEIDIAILDVQKWINIISTTYMILRIDISISLHCTHAIFLRRK